MLIKNNALVLSLVIALLFFCTTAYADIRYVDADADPGGDGESWPTAYKYLRDALYSGTEIWVAEGYYYPDQSESDPDGTENRNESFSTDNTVYGGFVGNETSRDQRSFEKYKTVLDGDIGNTGDNSDNSFHVVTGNSTRLDGVTVTNGNANGSGSDDRGGGYKGDGVLLNCYFTGNNASFVGGGVYTNGPGLTVVHCVFSGNSDGPGYLGGDIAVYYGGTMTAINSYFLEEVVVMESTANFYNCTTKHARIAIWVDQLYESGDAIGNFYNCNLHNSGLNSAVLLQGGSQYEAIGNFYYCNTFADTGSGGDGVSSPGNATENWFAGNIHANPLFIAPGTIGGPVVQSNSPCIDAGSNNYMPADSEDIDYDGNTSEDLPLDIYNHPRYFDAPQTDTGEGTPPIVDIGAYEYVARLYVESDADGDHNGYSWADAYNTLDEALAVVVSGEQIWVAAATYTPDTDGLGDPREATLGLINGVEIYGGFDGSERRLDQRDWLAKRTILSGDLGVNGNSYHVVTGLNTDRTAGINGFIIQDGIANGGSTNGSGGGCILMPVLLSPIVCLSITPLHMAAVSAMIILQSVNRY